MVHATHSWLPVAILYLPEPQAVHKKPLPLNPALQEPADEPLQSTVLESQVAHTVFPVPVLYLPPAQAVHVTPLPLNPATQVPADEPPQPTVLELQVAQSLFPAVVLYLPESQLAQTASLVVSPTVNPCPAGHDVVEVRHAPVSSEAENVPLTHGVHDESVDDVP